MSIRSPTYQQSVFKRYYSDKNLSEFLPARWRQKLTGIDMEQYCITVIVSPYVYQMTDECCPSHFQRSVFQARYI